jgi:filamentous hemagglutinin family protein
VSKKLSPWFGLALCILGYFCATNNHASAQVTSDGTVNTQVTENGNTAEITGGERAGDNLFHSFQDFSVGTGNEASFLNANDIANIFSRVTGGNISNIDGLISANGSANLFLINPAGIIFGENARLDVGGSFYGSTADSILFEDGEYSATDLDNPPVLTINAPIGLGFRDNPGDIVNRAVGDIGRRFEASANKALTVSPGKTIALIGGNVTFDDGDILAPGSNVELGGLSAAGEIGINNDGSLSFPNDVARSDVSLQNDSSVFVDFKGGGNITVNSRNLELQDSDFFAGTGSFLLDDFVSPNAQAGDIVINTTESVTLNSSSIYNSSSEGGNGGESIITTPNLTVTDNSTIYNSGSETGSAGNITINVPENITLDSSNITLNDSAGGGSNPSNITIATGSLEVINGGEIEASIFDQGDAGAVNIKATGDITIDGENSTGSASGVRSIVNPNAVGNAGGVTITTNNLNLTNGGQIDASTLGQGNAGAVNITATGNITADGENSEGFFSGIASQVYTDAVGDAGGVSITTHDLNLTNGGKVAADTFGQGNAGAVNITATGDITADGEDSKGFPSGMTSLIVETDAEGDAGGVTISTTNLNLTAGGRVSADTFGQGNAGVVDITATGDITADGETLGGSDSGIFSRVAQDTVGDAGGVKISTSNLTLTNGGAVDATTFGQGNAGDININALKSIFISGVEDFRIGISAAAVIENGNGGDININTNKLTIANNGIIEASNIDFQNIFAPGTGQPGNITIEANNLDLINRGAITAATRSTSDVGGIINLEIAENITLRDNSFISAQAFGDADGGNLNIDAGFIVAFPNNGTGNDVVATAEQGRGGNINLNAEQIFGLETGKAINDQGDFIRNNNNDLDASSNVLGFDGSINIDTSDINPVQGATELPSNVVEPEQNTAQACEAGRGTANSGLAIAGKGGVTPAPNTPLNSENLIRPEQNPAAYAIPEPIETSQGKIQPARGMTVTESGHIVLTAYPTNNAGERIPEGQINCGQIY